MIDTFAQISLVTGALLKLVALLLLLVLLVVAWSFRHLARKVERLTDRVHGDLLPLIQHATSVVDDVHHVTRSIRKDMAEVQETIAAANERVRAAMATTEQRVQDFNALLEVVQGEAEDLFVSSASTLRGVRSGAEALTRRGGPEFAVDDLDDGEDDAVDDMDDTDDLEMADGNDRSTESTENRPAHPRLRPRARGRG